MHRSMTYCRWFAIGSEAPGYRIIVALPIGWGPSCDPITAWARESVVRSVAVMAAPSGSSTVAAMAVP